MVDSVKTQRWMRAIFGTLALAAIAFDATAVVVGEGQAVLITRFGRPLRAATQPGLHWKLPWPIDQAVSLDMRRKENGGAGRKLRLEIRELIGQGRAS